MKIVLSTPYYPPHVGGIEVHVQNVAERLAKNHDVWVITSDVGRRSIKDGNPRVLRVKSINLPYSPIPLSFPEIEADVYHSHIPSPFFAREILRRNLHPHVITYHNDVIVPPRVDGKYVPRYIARTVEYTNFKIAREIVEEADIVISTTRTYAKTSPVLQDIKTVIIPNGIDTSSFTPGPPAGERDRIVLYTGRIVEYKGLGLLIKAMRDIDAKLVVVGDGEDRKRFQQMARKTGIDAIFTGRVSEEVKRIWMKKSRVLVLPSLNRLEAFGIVLLEAMASATPVIASNLPGVRDVALEGGYIFDDLSELREKLNLLLDDDSRASRIGKRGRNAVKKYDWEIILKKIEKLYHQLT